MAMATTQDILNAAQALGKLIAQHDAAKKFEETMLKLQADVEAQRVLNDFNRHLQKLGEKEQQGKPIEPSEKQQLDKLQTAVIRNPILRDFQLRQMDYLDLMRKVDEAISGGPPEGAAPGNAPAAPAAPGLVR
jgi:cell fate (sporulation/competence/biofilm development) regulator YlbF (YheA/YmcA/DUF963 family)